MDKTGENIKIEHIVIIRLIDKKTGKIEYESKSRNATLVRGAEAFIYAICGVPYTTPWNKVNIYTSTKSYIKTISGTFGTMGDGGTYKYIVLTASDESNDSYTFQYLGNHKDSLTTYTENFFAYGESTAKTKTSTQILQVTWEFRVGYSSAP